jgi:hypothetical protein
VARAASKTLDTVDQRIPFCSSLALRNAESLVYYFDSLYKITLPVFKVLSQLIYGEKITRVVKKYCLPDFDGVIPATMAFVDE